MTAHIVPRGAAAARTKTNRNTNRCSGLFLQTQTLTPKAFISPRSSSEAERYFRDLEARPVDERFVDFSATPAHAGGQDPIYNPAEMAAKL